MEKELKRTNDILDEVFTSVFGFGWNNGHIEVRQSSAFKIRDNTYPSARVAAEELGVTIAAIYAARAGDYLDRVGLRKPRST